MVRIRGTCIAWLMILLGLALSAEGAHAGAAANAWQKKFNEEAAQQFGVSDTGGVRKARRAGLRAGRSLERSHSSSLQGLSITYLYLLLPKSAN